MLDACTDHDRAGAFRIGCLCPLSILGQDLVTAMTRTEVSAGEDRAGFVVPRWRSGDVRGVDAVDVPTVCLAPWRPAPGLVVELLIDRVRVDGGDVVVDLGSGDGRVLTQLASQSGCRGIGIEASARLVRSAREMAAVAGVGDRVSFFHELIGCRGLRGATIVYCWLLPGSSGLVRSLVSEVLEGDGEFFRGLVVVGDIGDWPALDRAEVIGEIPDRGRIRSDAGLPVRWVSAPVIASGCFDPLPLDDGGMC